MAGPLSAPTTPALGRVQPRGRERRSSSTESVGRGRHASLTRSTSTGPAPRPSPFSAIPHPSQRRKRDAREDRPDVELLGAGGLEAGGRDDAHGGRLEATVLDGLARAGGGGEGQRVEGSGEAAEEGPCWHATAAGARREGGRGGADGRTRRARQGELDGSQPSPFSRPAPAATDAVDCVLQRAMARAGSPLLPSAGRAASALGVRLGGSQDVRSSRCPSACAGCRFLCATCWWTPAGARARTLPRPSSAVGVVRS